MPVLGAPPTLPHQVILTWIASADTVQGYNVYKGTAGSGSEGATPINGSSPVTTTTFTDTAVTAGESLVYYVTAVDNGEESPHSNEVSVKIPLAPPTNLVATAS